MRDDWNYVWTAEWCCLAVEAHCCFSLPRWQSAKWDAAGLLMSLKWEHQKLVGCITTRVPSSVLNRHYWCWHYQRDRHINIYHKQRLLDWFSDSLSHIWMFCLKNVAQWVLNQWLLCFDSKIVKFFQRRFGTLSVFFRNNLLYSFPNLYLGAFQHKCSLLLLTVACRWESGWL